MTIDEGSRASAQRMVAQFRTRLADRKVHPDRFAEWLATVPSQHQLELVRIAVRELPGLIGAAPGSTEAHLLAQSRMTQAEIDEHNRSRGTQ